MTQTLVRRAEPDDAEALVRLRGLMLEAMGVDVGGPDAPWREVALLDWFRDETEAGQVELHATQDGADLYRALGFVDSWYPSQRLTITR